MLCCISKPSSPNCLCLKHKKWILATKTKLCHFHGNNYTYFALLAGLWLRKMSPAPGDPLLTLDPKAPTASRGLLLAAPSEPRDTGRASGSERDPGWDRAAVVGAVDGTGDFRRVTVVVAVDMGSRPGRTTVESMTLDIIVNAFI